MIVQAECWIHARLSRKPSEVGSAIGGGTKQWNISLIEAAIPFRDDNASLWSSVIPPTN
jgi:hypothetical protein